MMRLALILALCATAVLAELFLWQPVLEDFRRLLGPSGGTH
jgi:hypothetical protein